MKNKKSFFLVVFCSILILTNILFWFRADILISIYFINNLFSFFRILNMFCIRWMFIGSGHSGCWLRSNSAGPLKSLLESLLLFVRSLLALWLQARQFPTTLFMRPLVHHSLELLLHSLFLLLPFLLKFLWFHLRTLNRCPIFEDWRPSSNWRTDLDLTT